MGDTEFNGFYGHGMVDAWAAVTNGEQYLASKENAPCVRSARGIPCGLSALRLRVRTQGAGAGQHGEQPAIPGSDKARAGLGQPGGGTALRRGLPAVPRRSAGQSGGSFRSCSCGCGKAMKSMTFSWVMATSNARVGSPT